MTIEKNKNTRNTKTAGAARKLSRIRQADPCFERESAQYPHPLPSREYVEQMLAGHGVPLTFAQLCTYLDVAAAETDFFERRLRAMERDGQVIRNRRDAYILPEKVDLIRGRVMGHSDGFGFLIREDKQPDVFLGPKAMREVLHGDRVIVRIAGLDRRGRPEGKIVEVLERMTNRVVGRVLNQHGVLVVMPEDRRIAQDILIAPGGKRVQAGQIVNVDLIGQPSRNARPIGRVVEVLGNYADPGMEIEIALRKHQLPFEFSAEAKTETRKLPAKVRRIDYAGREDIRHLPLVTIDGETAKDFDDAVYCERVGHGYRLLVAIADVSHYVQTAGALDADARERGNSVYFPRRVIPMLPEKLSNDLCSLMPQVERLCMVCDMTLSQAGVIKAYRFYPAVMFSHARLTYNQVAAALYENDATERDTLADLLPHLQNLDRAFRALLGARAKRGAIDFETTETRMYFDDSGKIERIVPESRNDAHRLIEECMLAANVCAAHFLQAHQQAGLYRVHEGPTLEKLEKLRAFLGEFGLMLGGADEPHARDYAKLLAQVKTRPDALLLQTVMLRSLRQAMYSPDNVGHFGLGYDAYAHFTSPIRRYPDLLVHRAIKAVLQGVRYEERDWDAIGAQCSATERRADDATRDVTAWLKCYYMRDRVGETFWGSVSAVVPFGMFVALDDVFVEGLVHVSDLGNDYFHFDETRHALVGGHSGTQFRLSDRVKVQLVRVDLETSKIDFRLLEGGESPRVRTGKTARDKGQGKAQNKGQKEKQPSPRERAREKHGEKKPPAAKGARVVKVVGEAAAVGETVSSGKKHKAPPAKTKPKTAAKKPQSAKKEPARASVKKTKRKTS